MNATTLQDRYARLLAESDDIVVRGLARAQLAHLNQPQGESPHLQAEPSSSRWRHVPLLDLLAAAGNRPHQSGRQHVSGHEPVHSSKSGTCLSVDIRRGFWYCRSCCRGGDAPELAMSLLGVDFATAARWLESEFGPAAPAAVRRARPPRVIEVWL